MPGVLKAAKKWIFGCDSSSVQQDGPVRQLHTKNRKRKLDDEEVPAVKRQRLVMDNIDTEEDVQIIPGETSFVERIISPIINFFSFRSTPVRLRSPTEGGSSRPEEAQLRRVSKDDLNAEIQFLGSNKPQDGTKVTQKDTDIQLIKHVKPAETIQASPPTRLDGFESQVQLLKVVNPNSGTEVIDLTDSSSQSSECSGVQPGTSAQMGSNYIGKRFHLITQKEKELQRERNKPAVLSSIMKSGKRDRSTFGKIMSPMHKYSTGVNFNIDLKAKQLYRNLLESRTNMSLYTPVRKKTYTNLFERFDDSNRFLASARHTAVRPGTSITEETKKLAQEIQEDLASPQGKSPELNRLRTIASPEPLDVTDSRIPIESTPKPKQVKVSSLEEENRTKEVYSKEFINNLNERFSHKKREIDRKIRAEQTKKDFHSSKNEELYNDVSERILRHLKLTSAVIDERPAAEEEEEIEDTNLPPITPKMDSIIKSAFRARDNEELILANKIPITGKDIATLKGLSWLNDEVINFYLQMIVARGETEGYEKVYAFNTFFYPKYRDNGYSLVRRWTKKVDLFTYSMVFVPIHLGMHWCLATINIKKKLVSYYDSMGGNNEQCVGHLLQYVQDEHKDKKKEALDVSGWRVEIVKNIPQQMNGSDCGMFTCKFAEYLSRKAKLTFSQENMPYFRRRMVYEIVQNDLLKP